MNTGTSRSATESSAVPSQGHGSGDGDEARPEQGGHVRHETSPTPAHDASGAPPVDAATSEENEPDSLAAVDAADSDLTVDAGELAVDLPTDPSIDPADLPGDLPPDVAAVLGEVTPGAPAEIIEDTPVTRSSVSNVDRERTRELFGRLRDMAADDPARSGVRDSLVEQHLPLVEHLARRFRNRGELYDDLVQVATIGLIKSVDRFDLERGVEFSTYATPTIVGEIKRHFRDKGWAVRVPRRLQELRLALTSATAELSQRNGRSPTVAELAGYLKISDEEVLEGLESANAYSTLSLDAGGEGGDDEGVAVVDTLGVEDEGLEGVEYRESLKPLLDQLAPREKKILMLRFFRNMTQSEIAREVGISQMHVSRLLARTLAQLREGLLTED